MSAKSNYKSPYKKKRVEHSTIVTGYLMAYDVVAVSLAYFLALLVRFDLRFTYIPPIYFDPWVKFAPFYAVICLLVFWRLKLYKSIWRFASFKELQRITLATIVTTVIHVIGTTITLYILAQGAEYSVSRMPFSYFLMGPIIQFFLITGVRFSYRFILLMRANNKKKASKNVLVIGAGAAGLQIIREIQHSPAIKEHVVCIIDDNPNKWNREIEGIPVVGGRGRILEAAVDYDIDKIYITIPSVTNQEKRKILDICKDTDCELMMLPGMYQIALGNVSVSNLKKVDVEDLLGREPVKMNSKPVRSFLSGKVVLVTGGGGSIGSELCRQVAAVKDLKQLIIFDIYENNAHAIRLELEDKYPDLDLVVLIGSVRDNRRVKEIFRDYRPNVVFHAAAHKHVPLMEDSPCEAIKNNVIGTYVTAYSAMIYGCEHFVLISTDKAVNPVNIMGASKRLCEMIVQTFAKKIAEGKAHELPDLYAHAKSSSEIPVYPALPEQPATQFAAVRFGNVLGSNGSVIPRFREQIAAGGNSLVLGVT